MPVGQSASEFDGVQRAAAGVLVQPQQCGSRQRDATCCRQHLAEVSRGEAGQVQHRQRLGRHHSSEVQRQRLGPVADEDGERAVRPPPECVRECAGSGMVQPVQVVHDDQQRRHGAGGLDDRIERECHRGRFRCVAVTAPDGAFQRGDMVRRERRPGGCRHRAEQQREPRPRQVGLSGTQRRAGDGDRLHVPDDLVDECGLADAGVADDLHHAFAVGGPAQHRDRELEFGSPPDEVVAKCGHRCHRTACPW